LGQLNESEQKSRPGFCFVPGAPAAGDVTMDTAPGPPCKDRTSVRCSGRAPELGRGHPTGKRRSSTPRLVGELFSKLASIVIATTTAF